MTNVKLKVGLWPYDHVQALRDGSVTSDGVDAGFDAADLVSEIFERTLEPGEIDALISALVPQAFLGGSP